MMEFFAQQPLYSVLLIVIICWIGIFSYLFKLGRKVSSLEEKAG